MQVNGVWHNAGGGRAFTLRCNSKAFTRVAPGPGWRGGAERRKSICAEQRRGWHCVYATVWIKSIGSAASGRRLDATA